MLIDRGFLHSQLRKTAEIIKKMSLFQLQAMKLLTRWLQGLKSNANNSGTSTLRLLYTVIIHEGDLMEKGKIK